MNKKSVIAIVGAGFAGVSAAKELEKLLYKRIRRDNDVEILLIDKNPFQTIMTGLHEAATERTPPQALCLELEPMFKKRGAVTVVTDTVLDIDTKNYVIKCINNSYHYDFIIIAAGCRTAYFGVSGAEAHAFGLWSLDEALKLRDHIRGCFASAAAESGKRRQELLSFYIVGAGFTGCELAGDMAEWFPALCWEYGINRSEPSITLVDMLPRAAGILPEKASKKVERRLEKMGIHLELGASVTQVTENSISFKNSGGVQTRPTAAVIWAAGIEGCTLMDSAGSILRGRGRRLVTDSKLRTDGAYAAFAAGDDLIYAAPGKAPAPQTVENAEQSGVVCARNAAAFIDGRSDLFSAYTPVSHGSMVTVGANYCAAKISLFGGRVTLSPPSFLAMCAKHGVNILYITKNCGLMRGLKYIKYEFFCSKNGRNFLCFKNPLA